MAKTLQELTSPEYTAELRRQAEAQLAPSLGLQNQAFDLGLNQLGIQETDIGREYDSLAETLRKQAETSTKGMEERQNQLGLLQSGMTAAGLGDIQKTLGKGLKESEQDRASRLANIALQRSGITLQRQEAQQNYQASISDLVDKLLAKDMELYKLEQSASSSGSGGSNPFAGLFGSGGTAAQAPSVPMIGNIPLSELQGNVIYGNDGSVSFATDQGLVTREQFADMLAGNQLGDAGRQTQAWRDVYKQILDNFKEQYAVPKSQAAKNIGSFIQLPGASRPTTARRGF